MRFDSEIGVLFTLLASVSLAGGRPSNAPGRLFEQVPLLPPKSAVALGTTLVDFASGSSKGLAAVDWDPKDDIAANGGIGCAKGSVGTVLANDNSYLALVFKNINAEVGPYVKNKDRTFCRVNVTINAPGWVLDVANVDFRGYWKLDAGVNASIRARWKLIGQHGRGKIRVKAYGPATVDHIVSNADDLQNSRTPKCSRNVTTLQLRLTARVKTDDDELYTGVMQGDPVDGRFKQQINLAWKKCSEQDYLDAEKDSDHSDDQDSQEDRDGDQSDEVSVRGTGSDDSGGDDKF